VSYLHGLRYGFFFVVAATGFAEWRGPDSGRIFARVQFFDGACDNDPDSDSNP
jgi:hypothetical protein